MKLLSVLLFLSLSLHAQVCMNNSFGFDPIEGEELASKVCIKGRLKKLTKDKVCDCQKSNKKLNLKASKRFRELNDQSNQKILNYALEKFQKNMVVNLNNIYSLSQFTRKPLSKDCRLSNLDSLHKRCGVDGSKVLGKLMIKQKPLMEIKEKILNERKMRNSHSALDLDGFSKRESKTCEISEEDALTVTGQRNMILIQRMIEKFKKNVQGGNYKDLDDYIQNNMNEASLSLGMSPIELELVMNEMREKPLFLDMLTDRQLLSQAGSVGVDSIVENTLEKLQNSCSKSFQLLEEVICKGSDESFDMDLPFYRKMGMDKSKGNIELELDNQVMSEMMCSKSSLNVPLQLSKLGKVYDLEADTLPTDEFAKLRSESQVEKATINICSVYPDIDKGLELNNCSENPFSLVCMDLRNFGGLNLIPKMIAKRDVDGNVIENEDGTTLQIPNPDYLSSKEINGAIYGKGSLVDSFYSSGKEDTVEEPNIDIDSSSGPNSYVSSKSDLLQQGSLRQAPSKMRQDNKEVSMSDNNFYKKSRSSLSEDGNKRIYDKLKDLVDSYKKHDSSTFDRVPKASRRIASTPQQVVSPTTFTPPSPSFNSFQAQPKNEVYEDLVPSSEEGSANKPFRDVQRNTAGSIGSGTIDDPTRRINPTTGKFNNGLAISSATSPYGEIPVVELYGNIEDEFFNIDPENMMNLDDSQKEILSKLQSLIEEKKPFYVSKRGDSRYRLLLEIQNGKYVVANPLDLSIERANFNKSDYIKFKSNIEKSLNEGVLEKLVDFNLDRVN